MQLLNATKMFVHVLVENSEAPEVKCIEQWLINEWFSTPSSWHERNK